MAIANVLITSLPEATSPSANDYLILQGESTQKIKWSVLLDKLYPVGCIYQSASSTSPASFLGGTWERIKDRFLLSAGDTYTAGGTGGEAAHALTINEIAAHAHAETKVMENGTLGFIVNPTKDGANEGDILGIEQKSWQTGKESVDTGKTGGSEPHNNMPPYLTVYVWKRVA